MDLGSVHKDLGRGLEKFGGGSQKKNKTCRTPELQGALGPQAQWRSQGLSGWASRPPGGPK